MALELLSKGNVESAVSVSDLKRDHSFAEAVKLVDPIGQPISISTNRGFKIPGLFEDREPGRMFRRSRSKEWQGQPCAGIGCNPLFHAW